MKTVSLIFLILIMLFGYHEIGVFSTRNNPPMVCQMFGGHWNVLQGWSCGE